MSEGKRSVTDQNLVRRRFRDLLKTGKAGLLADGGQLSKCDTAVVELAVEKVKHAVRVDVLPFRWLLAREFELLK